jgi:hypothetical protein
MKRALVSWLSVLLLALAGACGSPATEGAASAPRPNPRVITTEQISAAPVSNAYELVQTLRPGWLRRRGAQSIHNEGDIVVYYDQVRLGGPESLRSISVAGISRVEFIDAPTATQRWGTGHSHGVILVVTRS